MDTFKRHMLAIICGAALLSGSGLAGATGVSDCQDLIDTLRLATEGADFGGNNPLKTEASLLSKLDGASIKLDTIKFDDALQKMQQYYDAVVTLGVPNAKGQSKLDPDDSAELAAGAQEVIDCIQTIGL